MAAIFLSHASRNDPAASVLEKWLKANGFNDLFVDHDAIRAGDKWAEALRRAKASCRIVICLVSPEWLESDECYGEFKAAWYMGRRVIPLLWHAKDRLDERQKARLDAVMREDQGVAIAYTGAPGDFDLRGDPADKLRTGLRAAGALSQFGLDPGTFALDRTAQPEPFPGLESFDDTEADAAIFYGRGSEIAQCLEELREMRATGDRCAYAIQGASGSGKSSLLKAGILPRLRRERGWVCLRAFRPGTDPLYNFADALARSLEVIGPQAAGPLRDQLLGAWKRGEDLRAVLDRLLAPLKQHLDRPDATVLISMDQAEELPRIPGESADALGAVFKAALVGASADPRLDYLVALTVRSDSFHDLQQSPRFEGIRVRTTDVRTLATFHFNRAIEAPAARYGVEIDPRLVEQLMIDASGSDALPLLAFTLQCLWRQYAASGKIAKEAYEGLGKLSGIISDAAERALRGIDPRGKQEPVGGAVPDALAQQAARVFVPALAQVNDRGAAMRRVAKLSAFSAEDRTLVESFARWRLLVVSADTVEVAHEAMFRVWPRFHDWLEPEKERLAALQGLESAAGVWDVKGRKPEDLLHRGKRLAEARALADNPHYAAQLDDNPETRPYLAACSAIARRQRLRTIGLASGFAVVVILVAAIPALIEWHKAREARRIHDESAAAAEARAPDAPVLADGAAASRLPPGAAFRDCAGCPEMVVVPAGHFTMGSPKDVRDRLKAEDEGPEHDVAIAAPFAIGKYHVTYTDWDACERDKACPEIHTRSDPRRGRRPALAMSWLEAKGYADWLSKRTQQRYRLPTEAEWEYAARAGTTTPYFTGEDITHAQANFGQFTGGTDPAGTYPPNAFGLYDMAGNAWHWVADGYRRSYGPDALAYDDPCGHRVVRGGSWASGASDLRSAKRVDMSPNAHPDNTGFRLVREIGAQ